MRRNADLPPQPRKAVRPTSDEQRYLAEPVAAATPLEVPPRLPEYLLDRIGDMILVLERGGTIRYANATAERLLGWTPAGMRGKLVAYYLHPDDAPAAVDRFSHMLKQPGEALAVEVRFRHRDGSWRHFDAVGTNLLGTDIADGIVVTCRDINERKLAEARVEASERRFRRLVEHAQGPSR